CRDPLYLHSFPTRRSSDLGRKGLHGSSPWVEWASTRSCLRDCVRFSGELVHIEREFFRRLARRRFAGGIFPAPVSSRATRTTQTDRKSTRLNSSHDQTSYA